MSITKKHIVWLILISVLVKVIYVLFTFCIDEINNTEIIGNTFESYINLFQRNDSYWYKNIAENGYPRIKNPIELGYVGEGKIIQSVWAMFPLYPMVVKSIMSFGLPFVESAFIISLILSPVVFILFYLLGIHLFNFDKKKAFKSTFIFICFPFHYYFSMYYTEALFFILLALGFISVHLKKYWITCLSLFLLTIIRPNGIVSAFPVFLYYLEKEGGYLFWWNQLKMLNVKKFSKWLWFLSAPAALFLYCLYQKEMTNFYFAYVKAQEGWFKEFMFPLKAMFRDAVLWSQFNSFYTLLAFIVSIFLLKKLPLSLNLLIWLSLLLPLSSGSVVSLPRFISVLFPITILLSQRLTENRFYPFVVVILFGLQLWSFYPWIYSEALSY
jgi:hypothetical protein